MVTWILIRHAHRDTTIRALDNGLSEKGKEQARELLSYFKERVGKKGRVVLISSPKRRCVQTLEPIARYLGAEILFSDQLLEQKSFESTAALRSRVKRFLREYHEEHRGESATLLLCSHGDWLPLALEELCGVTAEVKKGSWAEIENGQLTHLLQPDDL